MKRGLGLILALMALGAPTGASAAISGYTETRQVAVFSGVIPNHQYSAYFYAYHYPGDPYPYALGYGGLPSNSWGEYKPFVLLSDLGSEYEPVYSVRVCLREGLTDVACTPYSYVGFTPLSLWTYAG